jgi:hypothetical protein
MRVSSATRPVDVAADDFSTAPHGDYNRDVFIHLRPALVAVFLVGAASSLDAADDAVRRELQSLYDRASAAAVARKSLVDAEATHRWLDMPDCVYKNTGQRWRAWAEMRRFLEAELQTPLQALSSQIQTIEVNADLATTITVVRGTARVVDHAGQFGPRGEVRELTTTATVRDIWTRTPSGWRRKSHEKIIPNRVVAVDGKPRPPLN